MAEIECCCGCVIFTDPFDRADSITIGGDWTAPGFSIAGNNATVPSPAPDQLAICNTNTESGPAGQRVTCDVKSLAAGDKIGVIFAVTDSSNYWRAYLELATGVGAGKLWLEEVASGSVVTTFSNDITAEPSTTYALMVCFSGSTQQPLSISVDGNVAIYISTFTTSGHRAGLYNGAANTNPTWNNYYQRGVILGSETCPECGLCGCQPIDKPQISEYLLVVAGMSGDPNHVFGFLDFLCFPDDGRECDQFNKNYYIPAVACNAQNVPITTGVDDCCGASKVTIRNSFSEGSVTAVDGSSIDTTGKCFIYVRFENTGSGTSNCINADYYKVLTPGEDLWASLATIPKFADVGRCPMPATIGLQAVA